MPSSPPGDRPHRVVALAQPPQSTFELAIAAEVFGVRRPGLPAHYTFQVCAEHPGGVPTLAGYELAVTAGLPALAEADTIVVPGRRPPGTPDSPPPPPS